MTITFKRLPQAGLMLAACFLTLLCSEPLQSTAQSTPVTKLAQATPQTSQDELPFSFVDACAPEASLLANVAATLAKAEQYDRALQLAAEIDHPTANPLLLVFITDRLAAAGQFDRAQSLAQTLTDSRYDASPLSLSPLGENFQQQALMVISFRLAELGKLEEALTLTQTLKDKALKSLLLFAIAAEFDSRSQSSRSKPLFDEAGRLLQDKESSFTTLALLDSTLDKMLKRGQIDQVLKIVQIVKDIQNKLPNRPPVLNNDNIQIKTIEKLLDLAQFDRALQLVENLPKTEFSQISRKYLLLKLATAAAQAGKIDFALQVNRRIEDQSIKTSSLRNIIIALSEQKEYDRALELANTISFVDSKAYALTAIAYRLWKAEQSDRARQLVNQIAEPDLKAGGLSILAEAAYEVGQTNQVAPLLTEAMQQLQKIAPKADSVEQAEKVLVLQRLAKSWAKLGQYGEALKVAQLIHKDVSKNRVLQAIALEMVEAKRYDQSLQVARLIENQADQTQALVQISARLLALEEYDRALKIIDQFPDNSKLESPDQLTNFTRILRGRELREALFKAAAVGLTGKGQSDRALQIAEQIEDPFSKAMTLGAMTIVLFENGKPEQAEPLLTKAREIARTAKPPKPSNNSLPPNLCLPY